MEKESFCVTNKNMELEYLSEEYQKLKRLGDSLQKETWLVSEKGTGKLYVWKEVPCEQREIYEKIKRMAHPNLAKIKAILDGGNCLIILEEYVSGETVKNRLQEEKQFSVAEAYTIITTLLQVLKLLHEQKIIHRDIQPGNLLISTDHVLKLLDFGIARIPKENQVQDTQILGTAGYAAPEQFGFTQSDERTDLYAVGVLFYQMLTGRMPMGNQCEEEVPYCDFISKCIAIDPKNRFFDAQAAYEALVVTKKATPEYTTIMGKDFPTRFLPAGLKSGSFGKKLGIGFLYFCFILYMVECVKECSGTLPAMLLEIVAVCVYLVLCFLVASNYGEWCQRLFPFSKMKRSSTVVVQVFLAIACFYWGYLLEIYVRGTLLGLPIK